MRCGICGLTTETRNRPDGTIDLLPIRNAWDLVGHKWHVHPEEYRATLERTRATREATKVAAATLARRQLEE